MRLSGLLSKRQRIAYGSTMKVWSGRYFQRHLRREKTTQNIDANNLEENLMKVLKNSPVIRTGTSSYAFVRMLSKGGYSPTLIHTRTISSPESSPKQGLKLRLPSPKGSSSPKGGFWTKGEISPIANSDNVPIVKANALRSLLQLKGSMWQKRNKPPLLPLNPKTSPKVAPISGCPTIAEDPLTP